MSACLSVVGWGDIVLRFKSLDLVLRVVFAGIRRAKVRVFNSIWPRITSLFFSCSGDGFHKSFSGQEIWLILL